MLLTNEIEGSEFLRNVIFTEITLLFDLDDSSSGSLCYLYKISPEVHPIRIKFSSHLYNSSAFLQHSRFKPSILFSMAHSSNISLDPSMRHSASQPPVLSAATIGAMLQQENNSLANKSDSDAIYDLVSLGTRYSSSIVAFSQRVQAKNHEVERLKEQIVVLQRIVQESHTREGIIRQKNKQLKSLLDSSFRLPVPMDKNDMILYEENERLKHEAKNLKFM